MIKNNRMTVTKGRPRGESENEHLAFACEVGSELTTNPALRRDLLKAAAKLRSLDDTEQSPTHKSYPPPRVTEDELREMLQTMTGADIAREFNVTRELVRQWCAFYGFSIREVRPKKAR